MATVHDFNCPPGFEPEVLNVDDPSKITADLEDENIELWMIKAPLNFDISLLSGHGLKEHFNIPSKKKSDIEFVAKATENHPMCKTIQTVFPHKTKSKLTIGPSFKGYVDIVQSVKIPKCSFPELPKKKPYQIPSNLKQRYIPYGSHSPPRISSPEIVKEKSKKRKRSKSLSTSVPDLDASQASQIDLDASQVSQVDTGEPPLKKKRKKHKNKDLGESFMSIDLTDDSCPILPPQASVETPKPNKSHTPNCIDAEEPTPVSEKKKKKKKRDKDEINGSLLENVQDPLMNVSLQNSIIGESMVDPISPVIGSGKKKLKKKSGDLNMSTLVNNDEPCLNILQNSIVDEILSESDTQESKKKHRKKSGNLNLSSFLNQDESSYLGDESLTKSGKKKKKKSKEKDEEKKIDDDHNKTVLNILDNSVSRTPNTESSSRKKHKSEKMGKEEKTDDLNDTDIIILDETFSQTPNGESSKKKKKKHKKDKEKEGVEDFDPNTTAIITIDDGDNETPNVESSSKKKKKKKHREGEEEKIENDDHNGTAIISLDDSTSQKASSSKKKSKKRKLSEVHDNAVPLVNGFSTDTAGDLERKDSGIGSLEMESTHLDSVDSVLEQSVTSSHKKKKKKHEHSLDETYLQLNIPT